ncbi:hypothetical protein AGMMS50230_15090 [Spirochaetia bacterium]|nr:hypothetical protein AGMMS50230_15090 [Spirochaetia bacterium]
MPRIIRSMMLMPLLLIVSCIGVSSSIELNGDGSGKLQLEYRLAGELEDLGKLDGNEKWLPVPVGRADMERTVSRTAGLKLLSYTVREEGKDRIYRSELSFTSPEALTAFFGAGEFRPDIPGRKLSITFAGSQPADKEWSLVVKDSLQGYSFSLSLKVPGTAAYTWFDKAGNKTAVFPGTCSTSGQKLEYTVSMADLVLMETPLSMEVRW